MPAPEPKPIIVEPDTSQDRTADPGKGKFLLYDAQFPIDTNPAHSPLTGSPLRLPHFASSEVATWVFARNPDWLKHRLKGKPYRVRTGETRSNPLQLNDQPLKFRSIAKGRTGERRFTLADIERLAWALYGNGDIDGHELQKATRIVLAVAEQHLYRVPEES